MSMVVSFQVSINVRGSLIELVVYSLLNQPTAAVGYKKPARDPPGDIYSYDIKSNTWELVQPSPDSSPVIWSMEGGSTYAPELGQFFYMGGYEDAWVNSALEGDGKNSSANYKLMRPYHTVPGFLRLDMEADAGPKWTNETIKYADGSIEDLQRVRGQLIYVPLGKQGIIVKLGGEDYKTGLGNEVTRASNLVSIPQEILNNSIIYRTNAEPFPHLHSVP